MNGHSPLRVLRSLLGLTIVMAGTLLALKLLYASLSPAMGADGAVMGPAILVALTLLVFLRPGKGRLPPPEPGRQEFSLHPAISE